MRLILGFLFGFVPGVTVGLLVLFNNSAFDAPRAARIADAPLVLPIAGNGTVRTFSSGTGYPWVAREPAFAPQPEITGTRSAVDVMQVTTGIDGGAGFLVRLRSLSDAGKPLFGEMIEQSTIYAVLPSGDSLLIESRDDLWAFARQLTVPLLRGARWEGNLVYRSTLGPDAGFGAVYGLSGRLAGARGRTELMQSVRRIASGTGVPEGDSRVHIDLPPVPAETALADSTAP